MSEAPAEGSARVDLEPPRCLWTFETDWGEQLADVRIQVGAALTSDQFLEELGSLAGLHLAGVAKEVRHLGVLVGHVGAKLYLDWLANVRDGGCRADIVIVGSNAKTESNELKPMEPTDLAQLESKFIAAIS